MPHNSPCQGVTAERAPPSPAEAIIHLTANSKAKALDLCH